VPHVVTQSCCSDASCVYACPVNCIQPTPDDPAFATAEMLYVDPSTCVDCGACVSACPVDAIKPHAKLAEHELPFVKINADYHATRRPRPPLAPAVPPLQIRARGERLRVAVVGSGPAAMYTADEILTIPGARVSMFERLRVPYGLARHGVAPDHQRTRRVSRQFDQIREQAGLSLFLGVEVGRDVSHEELLRRHHAVVYAVGASSDKRLEIPGIDLPGTASATEFVAWYNGRPDQASRRFDLSHRRAVVIGNGNVALDVARILTIDPESLAQTDIALRALAELRKSNVEEVVVVARRGPGDSKFTLPELVGLSTRPGIELTVSPDDLAADRRDDPRLDVLRKLPQPAGRGRRITLKYNLAPTCVVGDLRVEATRFEHTKNGPPETIEAGLLMTSIGYRGRPVAGLPFDKKTATVPNDRGRIDPGTYVAGWIKRGPTGFIGTNKACARETVDALVEDFNSGRLTAPRTRATARVAQRRRQTMAEAA